MNSRVFYILNVLKYSGETSMEEIMKRLWDQDSMNRDLRPNPWSWYYNVTKYFAPLMDSNYIALRKERLDRRKVWAITEKGLELHAKLVEKGTVLNDPLFLNYHSNTKIIDTNTNIH